MSSLDFLNEYIHIGTTFTCSKTLPLPSYKDMFESDTTEAPFIAQEYRDSRGYKDISIHRPHYFFRLSWTHSINQVPFTAADTVKLLNKKYNGINMITG